VLYKSSITISENTPLDFILGDALLMGKSNPFSSEEEATITRKEFSYRQYIKSN
jgi:hypothetical protein